MQVIYIQGDGFGGIQLYPCNCGLQGTAIEIAAEIWACTQAGAASLSGRCPLRREPATGPRERYRRSYLRPLPGTESWGWCSPGPELAYTPSGEAVASFRLATSSPVPASNGLISQRCSAWNQGSRRLADLVLEHLHASDVVYVEGTLLEPLRGAFEDSQSRSPNLLGWDLQLLEPSRRASRAVGCGPGARCPERRRKHK